MSMLAPSRILRERVDRWSLVVFVVVVVLAVPLLLYLGRDQWFFLDEWWLLSDGAGSHDGIFDAHNGHWITLPAILYRINYWVWGLRTYVPYQVPVVLLHVGSAVLLRTLMRRMGVRGWIATAAALVFVFFGTGSVNIFFGFQVSLTGSLFCGLALLLLADQDGPINRRDWLALAVGVVGLMTSGVFVAMVAGVAVAVLLRRGLAVAAFYTVPLGVIYGAWHLLNGQGGRPMSLTSPGESLRFMARMFTGTFTSLAQSDLGGGALELVVAGTLVVLLTRFVGTRESVQIAIPVALLTAWVAFAGLTALAREPGVGAAWGATDRYVHVTAALFLPVIALGAEYLARQHVLIGTLPVLLLAAGLPGNVDELSARHAFFDASILGGRGEIVGLAHSEHIDDVGPDLEPITFLGIRIPITTGWLAREAKAGRIPTPTNEDLTHRLTNYALLALRQQENGRNDLECAYPEGNRVELTLVAGEQVVFESDIRIWVREGRVRSAPIVFRTSLGSTLVAELGPLDLLISGTGGGQPRFCKVRPH